MTYRGFTDDAAIDSYAKAAVQELYSAGIISGYTDGSFRPIGQATRAEAAAMMHRFLEAMKQG